MHMPRNRGILHPLTYSDEDTPMSNENMKRINFMLPPQMLQALGAKAKEDGRTVSEHIRQALTEYLRRQDNEQLGRNKG